MERLTKLNPLSGEIERNGLPQQLYKKLWEYEKAEEQGLIAKLPCKVGDIVYYVALNLQTDKREALRSVCSKIILNLFGIYFEIFVDCKEINNCISFELKDFGKTIFLTEAEALQALKARE